MTVDANFTTMRLYELQLDPICRESHVSSFAT
jgi:hypothetical protein